MEKGVTNLMEEIREAFALKDVDIRSYSPLVLAYIGDGIYELVIRSLLVGHGNAHASTLHKKASSPVGHDGTDQGTAYPGGTADLPPGPQCQYGHHGEARLRIRLPESYGL